MKNKFGNLIKNESIKLFSKTGNKVLIILVFVLAIAVISGMALLDKFVFSVSSSSFSLEKRYEYILQSIEYYQESEIKYKEVYIAEDTATAEAIKFFIDNDIADTWKSDNYLNQIDQYYNNIELIKLITDGKLPLDDVIDFLPEIGGPDGPIEYDENTDYNAILDNLTKNLEKLKEYVLELSPNAYYTGILTSYEGRQSELEQDLKDYEAEEVPTSATRYYIESIKLELEVLTALHDNVKYLSDNDISPDDWRASKLIFGVALMASGNIQECAIPEKEFYESQEGREIFDYYTKYESYVSSRKRTLKQGREVLAIADYALKNNIMPASLNGSSVKATFRNNASGFASVLALIIAVMACNIVASEHTSGTIRLLLIRPRTRSEILNSKYVTLLLTTVVATSAAYFIAFILAVIFGGIGDSFTPDLVYNGTVKEVPAVLFTLGNLLLSIISTTLFMTIGFFFSVLIKKASGSTVITILLDYISSTVSMAAMAIMSSSTVISAIFKFTILPYSDLISLRANALDSLAAFYGLTDGFSLSGIFSTVMSTMYGNLSYGLSSLLGAIIVLLHIVLIWFFANLIFKKQEIKN